MTHETLTIREIRPESRFERHLRLDGASEAFVSAYTEPGCKVRIEAGGVAGEAALSSRPGRLPIEVLVEDATPLGAALAKGRVPGQTVSVSLPFGDPIPLGERRGDRLLLVGRGGGVGVVRAAVLRAIGLGPAFSEVTAVLEGLYPSDIAYRDEIPAWQRAGVKVVQTLSRPDVAKWKNLGALPTDAEGAYVYDFLTGLLAREPFDPEALTAVVAGPDDLVQGVLRALRALEVPPQKVHVFDLASARAQHRPEPERPANLLAKVATEGIWGSGHQDDVPDHPPVLHSVREQPRAGARPRYKVAARKGLKGPSAEH